MTQVSTGGVNGGAMEIPVEVQRFIEKLTFADSEDLWESLQESMAEDWMALPVWARNLAFRLLCLQRPDDAKILAQAGSDLLSFGPDWDDFAEELLARSEEIKRAELIEMVQTLIDARLPEDEEDALLEQVERSVPHPQVMDLIYQSIPQLTAEQVVDEALSYRPIEL